MSHISNTRIVRLRPGHGPVPALLGMVFCSAALAALPYIKPPFPPEEWKGWVVLVGCVAGILLSILGLIRGFRVRYNLTATVRELNVPTLFGAPRYIYWADIEYIGEPFVLGKANYFFYIGLAGGKRISVGFRLKTDEDHAALGAFYDLADEVGAVVKKDTRLLK